ncbi:MAG: type II toxin-antitoxin system RelE/ParE family toxin [Anaerolineae bacterium]
MTEAPPNWLLALLERYGETEPATGNAPTSPAERSVSWNASVLKGLARLSRAERQAIEQAVERQRRHPAGGRQAAVCDAFREIAVGRYRVFYVTRGDRIEVTGLRRAG